MIGASAVVTGVSAAVAPSAAYAQEAVEQTPAERRAAKQAKKAKREANLRQRIREARQAAVAARNEIKALKQRPGSWNGSATGPTITHTSSNFSASPWMNPPSGVPAAAVVRAVSWGVSFNHLPDSTALTLTMAIQAQSQVAAGQGQIFSSLHGILYTRGSSLSAAQPFRFMYRFRSSASLPKWGTRIPFHAFTAGPVVVNKQNLAVSYQY